MATSTTIQSNIKQHLHDNLTDYALFVGGLNVTHEVLESYDPLRTGYGRLFMVRIPTWLNTAFGTSNKQLKKFKHILEYGNTAVSGLNDIEVDFNTITGGYAGKSFDIPSVARDTTNEFTVTCYEFSGSPIREVIWTWVNGTTDLLTGLTHYNGIKSPDYSTGSISSGTERLQSNQTAEFVYVATDNTGENVEYCCLLANCFPVNVKNDQFNYQSGTHDLVEYAIQFRCTKYESLQINLLGQALLDRYMVLANSLNFYSGISSTDLNNGTAIGLNEYTNGTSYDITTGKLTNAAPTPSRESENNSMVPADTSQIIGSTTSTSGGGGQYTATAT